MGVMDTLKGVSNIVKEIGDIELNRNIIDLQQEVYGLIEENHNLNDKIRELSLKLEKQNDISELKNNLVFKDNHYYHIDDNAEKEPYCSPCWDNNGKLIKVHNRNAMGIEYKQCPVCNT